MMILYCNFSEVFSQIFSTIQMISDFTYVALRYVGVTSLLLVGGRTVLSCPSRRLPCCPISVLHVPALARSLSSLCIPPALSRAPRATALCVTLLGI